MTYIDTWIPRLLLAIFVFAGAVKFTKRGIHDAARWELSLPLVRTVGVVEIVAAVTLFWYPYWAAAVLLCIMAGALGVTVKQKLYKELVHPLVTTAMLGWVLARNL